MASTGSARGGSARLRAIRLFAGLALLACGCGATPAEHATRPSLSLTENPIETTRKAIDAAEVSLRAVLYKFDEPSLLPALMSAIERGVDVRLLVDSAQAGGFDEGEGSLVESARAAGAAVRYWDSARGKLHAKFSVLDGRRALAGSYNWTRSARRSNVELLLDIDDPETVSRLLELFEQLWDRAADATPE